MSPSLEEAAAELYAVEPGRFTAERTRLTGEARQAKDTETAKAIAELRRPTTSAWLINQLVRGEQGAEDEVERLDQLGQELREAQAALDAPLMRELTKERQQLVGALARRADVVATDAGQKMSAAVRREVEDTLGAAVADEQAALAVMSGRLTRALTYAGFGEVDIADATATPLSVVLPYKARRNDSPRKADEPDSDEDPADSDTDQPEPRAMKRSDSKLAPAKQTQPGSSGPAETDETGATSRTGKANATNETGKAAGKSTGKAPSKAADHDSAEPRNQPKPSKKPAKAETAGAATAKAEDTKAEKLAARRAEAEAQVAAARSELEAAEQSLRDKEQELEQATTEQTELQTRLNELQAEVVAVRRKLDAGDRRVSHAERDVTRQERQLKDVTKSLDRAESALDRLDQAQG